MTHYAKGGPVTGETPLLVDPDCSYVISKREAQRIGTHPDLLRHLNEQDSHPR